MDNYNKCGNDMHKQNLKHFDTYFLMLNNSFYILKCNITKCTQTI